MGIETIVVVIEEDGSISIVATDDGVPVEVHRRNRRCRRSRL
jgi:DNA gyrase/topoisomerase IV subunit B